MEVDGASGEPGRSNEMETEDSGYETMCAGDEPVVVEMKDATNDTVVSIILKSSFLRVS